MEKNFAIEIFRLCEERNAMLRDECFDGADSLAREIAAQIECKIWEQATAGGWGRELWDICQEIEHDNEEA
jgi:hypothetical protein